MMNIREYAKSVDFEIIGKLTYKGIYCVTSRWYTDEAGNEYFQSRGGITIVDKDGAVW